MIQKNSHHAVKGCEAHHWRIHAFEVMNNHFHLAVETPEANLGAGMQWLQATWANRFNRYNGEPGRPFQRRFKGTHVEPVASCQPPGTTGARNSWLNQRLAMGTPVSVTQFVGRFLASQKNEKKLEDLLLRVIAKIDLAALPGPRLSTWWRAPLKFNSLTSRHPMLHSCRQYRNAQPDPFRRPLVSTQVSI